MELTRFFGIDLRGEDIRVLMALWELKQKIEKNERLNLMQDIRVAVNGTGRQVQDYIIENFMEKGNEERIKSDWEKLRMIGRG